MQRIDVDREMREVRRKVQIQIDRDCLVAEAKIFGMEPIEYAAMRAQERRDAAEARRQQELEITRRNGEALGQQLRIMADSWNALLKGISDGFGR